MTEYLGEELRVSFLLLTSFGVLMVLYMTGLAERF